LIDELQTPVGKKNNKIWVGTVVNKSFPGILAFVLGDRSSETFKPLWKITRGWECFFYVTDGYVVDPQFINQGDRIVSKTYMTRAWRRKYSAEALFSSPLAKNFMLFKIFIQVRNFPSPGYLLPKTQDRAPAVLNHPPIVQRQ
jgi:IS1 family transposase